jgi:hypothetical protein
VAAGHALGVFKKEQMPAMIAVEDLHNPKWYNFKTP